jgi:cell division septum initiation protein DivIVA
MSIDDVLDTMDELLDKAATVPFTVKKCIIDSEQMRDLINELRLYLPSEIKQARHITQDRNEILRQANSEAEAIIKRAEERAKSIASSDEIVRLAKQQANDMITQAQRGLKEAKSVVDVYVDQVLLKSEEALRLNLEEIRKKRSEIKAVPLSKKAEQKPHKEG